MLKLVADGKYAQTEWRKVPEYQGGVCVAPLLAIGVG